MQFGHILHCNLALLGFEPALDLEPDFLLQKQPSSLIDALLYFVFTKYSAKEAHKVLTSLEDRVVFDIFLEV